MNLNSVDTQKYETLRRDNFSKKESRESSFSFLVEDSSSFIETG